MERGLLWEPLPCREPDQEKEKTMKSAKSWMKSWLAAALATVCAVAVARGETDTVDGVAWSYSLSEQGAILTGADRRKEPWRCPPPWAAIP